jgi:hypothetical protein
MRAFGWRRCHEAGRGDKSACFPENNRIATLRESISSSGYAPRVYSLNLSTGVRFGIGSPPLIAIVVLDGDSAHTASCHTPCISF